MRAYRQARMEYARSKLGGKCARCGGTEQLEFDHIDRATKTKPLTCLLHASQAVFDAELAKCQLLCVECHKVKTKENREYREHEPGPIKHGTLWAYDGRKCRCDACKAAKKNARKGAQRWDAAPKAVAGKTVAGSTPVPSSTDD